MSHFTQTLKDGIGRGLIRRYALMGLARARLLPRPMVYEWALVPRPHYAFGLLQAAREAQRLGHSGITAIEFGVAGGNGLLEMEAYANDLSAGLGMKIRVVGFDSGVGLPAPRDYRDLPHLWAPGDFDMDRGQLEERLTSAQLIIGQISETLPEFLDSVDKSAPVGFVAIDVDLWSSTRDCLRVFDGTTDKSLPRVWCYFDDIVNTIPDVGELLAIHEFNEEHGQTKIRQPFNLRANIPLQPSWAEQMWQVHNFEHPDYARLIAGRTDRDLPLQP